MVLVESVAGSLVVGTTSIRRTDWYNYCRRKGRKPSDFMITQITEGIDMKKYCSSLYDMTLLQYLVKTADPRYVVLSGSAIRFREGSLAEFGSVVLTFDRSDSMIILNDQELVSKLGEL